MALVRETRAVEAVGDTGDHRLLELLPEGDARRVEARSVDRVGDEQVEAHVLDVVTLLSLFTGRSVLFSGGRQLLIGAVLGFAAVASTLMAYETAPGHYVDPRNVLVALSGPFGGLPGMVLTTAMAALSRLSQGGVTVYASAISTVLVGLAVYGVTAFAARRDRAVAMRDLLVLAGLAVLITTSVRVVAEGGFDLQRFLAEGLPRRAALAVGIPVGAIAGYFGGVLDDVISRVIDTLLAFPGLLLAIALVAVLGPSLVNVILVMGVTRWVQFARIVRADVLSIREREFVVGARARGNRPVRLLLRHVLPNALTPIIVAATLELAFMIIYESALSFLGLGVQPPTPTWGWMLADGRNYVATAWWLATFPGLAIMLTVLAVNLLGDWLRDTLDPRLKV